jgi:hypothetical protein
LRRQSSRGSVLKALKNIIFDNARRCKGLKNILIFEKDTAIHDLALPSDLKFEKIRQFDDECTFPGLVGESVLSVAIYNVQVAERVVSPIEADVGDDMGVGVVLNERMQCYSSNNFSLPGP